MIESPEVGKQGWAIDSLRYPLPSGLSHRTRVTVVGILAKGVTVRDGEGREWPLCDVQVDVGRGYYLDWEYCHETHPKAVLHLRHTVLALQESIRMEREAFHCSGTWWQEDLERTRWYLTRNGFDPDEPVPPGKPPELTGPPHGV